MLLLQQWTRQPPCVARVNPAVSGLKAFWQPGLNPGWGGGPVGTPTAMTSTTVRGAVSGAFDGSNSRVEIPSFTNSRHTIMVGGIQVATAGLHYAVGANYNDGGSNIEHFSLRNNAGNIELAYFNGSGFAAAVASPALGTYNTYFGLLGAGAATDDWFAGYINENGVEVVSSATSVAAASRVGQRVWIGCGANAGAPWRFWNTQITWVAIFDRWLSAGERRQYAQNPWQLLAPQDGAQWFAESTGGSVGTSSITFTPTGTGASLAASSGSSSITFTPTGTGASRAAADASSSVTFTVSGVGSSASSGAATGTSSITFTPTGTGASLNAATGTSSITFSVTGSTPTTAPAVGTSSITFSVSGSSGEPVQIGGHFVEKDKPRKRVKTVRESLEEVIDPPVREIAQDVRQALKTEIPDVSDLGRRIEAAEQKLEDVENKRRRQRVKLLMLDA